MIRSEAVIRVQRGLAFRGDKVLEIEDALRDTQVELENSAFLPWFLKTEVADFDQRTTVDEERVRIPDDFIREVEADALWYFNSTTTVDSEKWTPLQKDIPEFLREDLPGSGSPRAYALTKDYFRIFPTPDAQYQLKMVFYKNDELLTSNVENEWLKYASDVMIGRAGIRIASALRDQGAISFFSALEQSGISRMINETEAREAANFRYVMGGPD